MSQSLASYCRGFARAGEAWPPLPLADAPEVDWWRQLIGNAAEGTLVGKPLVRALESALPQLRLPQVKGISTSELYKALVLRGEVATVGGVAEGLSHQPPQSPLQQPEQLKLWIAPHPCGAMPVLETPNWEDFMWLVRALAHRGEPVAIVNGVHAQAISGLIHWGLIPQFGRQSRTCLIVLHQAHYGSVPASLVPGGLSEADWLEASTTLRLEHELTHLATKRLLGEMRINLLDELIADCMGMVAALGLFSAELFGRCLGSGNDEGRWTTYTNELDRTDARQALELVMARAGELEKELMAKPHLLQSSQAMRRLQFLSSQRLHQPIHLA
jgi:hypothetical protein